MAAPDAETSPERPFCHVYGCTGDSDQLLPGWPSQLVAALESGPTSWTALLDARRLHPADDVYFSRELDRPLDLRL